MNEDHPRLHSGLDNLVGRTIKKAVTAEEGIGLVLDDETAIFFAVDHYWEGDTEVYVSDCRELSTLVLLGIITQGFVDDLAREAKIGRAELQKDRDLKTLERLKAIYEPSD